MEVKDCVINSITLALVDKTGLSASEIKGILNNELRNYTLVEMKTTLPSTTNGEATRFLFRKFAEAKVSAGMKQKTLYQYQLAVQKLCNTEKLDINMITSDNITHFINTLRANGSSPSTVRNKYLLLSSVFAFLVSRRYIAYNPMNETETPKEYHKIKKPLTAKEIESIKLACESFGGIKTARRLAMINFMLDTGVRVSELCNIKISDIDFNDKSVLIHGKGDKDRLVFFHDTTAVRLEEYFRYRTGIKNINGQLVCAVDTPLFASYRERTESLNPVTIQRELKVIGENSGVVRVHPHLLRATFATNLAKKGVGIEIIAQLLGHANLHTINRYVLMDDTDIKNIVYRAA